MNLDKNYYEDDEEIDIKGLRYAVYLRKSSDDPKKQMRSIPDQIAEIEDMAKRWKIKLVKPYIEEEQSAKIPNQRPEFKKLISLLTDGKCDAIATWHPDRLARNMKEGGQILDLVNNKIIKDLKFCSYHYSNDYSGRMLLGMAFVLSTEYSDRLSANVSRGVKRSFLEGKTGGTYKPGYIVDNEQNRYYKDAHTFDIVKDAWKDRLAEVPYQQISDNMNQKGFKRIYKKDKNKISYMTPQKLTKMFQDPIYYGILIQKGNEIDLRNQYDFDAMISEEEYREVQVRSRSKIPYAVKKRHTFYPLKKMILCDNCGRYMYAGASRSGTTSKRYLYYNCQNSDCTRSKKSIRAKVIFDWIYEFLENGLNFTEKDYDRVNEKLLNLSEAKKNKLMTEINSIRAVVHKHEREMKELALGLAKLEKDTPEFKISQSRIREIDKELESLNNELADKKDRLDSSKDIAITLDNFLNLSKKAGSKVKAGNAVQKDNILRKIFLNLSVNEENVVSYLCKEPFSTLLKDNGILNGRGSRTRTCDLTVPNRAR